MNSRLLCLLVLSLSAWNVSMAQIRSKASASVAIPVGLNTQNIQKWSSPSSWEGNKVPGAGERVIIPSNSTIVLDQNINIRSLDIQGKLIVEPRRNISLTANYIMIMGTGSYMEWGTESIPYDRIGVLTLTGNPGDPKMGDDPMHSFNSKVIMVMSGGRLEMHGRRKDSWVKLGRTAKANAADKTIYLDKPVNWAVNDQIIITTTELETTGSGKIDKTETEKRTIRSIAADRRTIVLDSVLKFDHFGELQNFSNGSRTWTVDERAEVGLLSRNLKVQGDANSSKDLYGGHMMSMQTASTRMSGVELYRMGQLVQLGHYPFHWHLARDVRGQYIQNCSVHESYNRAITVHGTQNALVKGNVCYDILGHAIFLEDRVETGNTIEGNLVSWVKKPIRSITNRANIIPLLASDTALIGNRIEGPAAFWISNPNNTVINNAASSAGTGFWYALAETVSGPSFKLNLFPGIKAPNRTPLGTFNNNTAHACYVGFDVDFVDVMDANGKPALKETEVRNAAGARIKVMLPYIDAEHYHTKAISEVTRFENFTGYKNYRAIWYRGDNAEFNACKLADNMGRGQFVATFNALFQNGVIVGHSANAALTADQASFATSIYDGNETIRNTHFENFDKPNQSLFTIFGGAQKHMPLVTSGITMKNCRIYNHEQSDEFSPYVSFVKDEDGSLLGAANTWATTNHPFIIDNTNFTPIQAGNPGMKTSKRFARIRFDMGDDKSEKQIMFHEFADAHVAHSKPVGPYYDMPVMINGNRTYKFRFTEFVPKRTEITFAQGNENDQTYFILQGLSARLNVSGADNQSNPAQVRASNVNAYCFVNNEMHIKMVLPTNTTKISTTIVLTTTNNANGAVTYPDSRPYRGTAHGVNATIQFENYDLGGRGVAYWENINRSYLNGESYVGDDHRSHRWGEMIDIKDLGASNFAIHGIEAGEWWKYTVNVPADGEYELEMMAASAGASQVSVFSGTTNLGNFTIPTTQRNTTYRTASLGKISLRRGVQVIRLEAVSGNFALDWFTLKTANAINQAPQVALTAPANGAGFIAPATVQLSANASDADGSVARVEFLNGNTVLGTDLSAPYTFTWNNVAVGNYTITARATDDKGLVTTSAAVQIRVNALPPCRFV
ncbi:MAG: Ig-like domain-containing protein [Cytophagaceae bacterium]|nr:Ig-like domain-containing protein [Cytophagaceae bacterium]